MSDVFKEGGWGSGVIAADSPVEARPELHDPHALDKRTVHTQAFGTLTHREFQQYLKESAKATVVHSDGFLSLSHIKDPPAYVCRSCGFNGLFRSHSCARCNSPVQTHQPKGN